MLRMKIDCEVHDIKKFKKPLNLQLIVKGTEARLDIEKMKSLKTFDLLLIEHKKMFYTVQIMRRGDFVYFESFI